jgi:putative ABC transport system permease protein
VGNTVRLHARDEIADGTLSHGADLVGAMARIPFIFLAVISLGFVAMLVASADSRRREFIVMRTVGATRWQIARVLVSEALHVACAALVAGFAGGALVGWLCTAGTRAAMANWGLPACFSLPLVTCLEGALGAAVFALLVAIPTSLRLGLSKMP